MRYSFADCILDTDRHRFARGGEEVALEPQVFDLLQLLAENAGLLVTKDQLVDKVWTGRIVSDATISARINAARNAVGDNGKDQAIIRTHSRRGFELVAPLETESPENQLDQPATEPTRQVIRYALSADGTGVAYSISGSGPPLLRAQHQVSHLELDWNSPFFRPTFDLLGESHTLVRYDIRGTGLSDADLEGVTIEHHVEDMKAVADAAGLERFPIHANLQSVAVAVRFAATYPHRISKLVLQDGYCRGRAIREDAPKDYEADPMISLLRGGDWGDPTNGFMRGWATFLFPDLSYDETTDMILQISAACKTENMIELRMIIDHFDSSDYLSQVSAPTLVIPARNNAAHPLKEGRFLAAGIEGAELLVIEGGNIFCIASSPTWQQQMDAIQEFLARK